MRALEQLRGVLAPVVHACNGRDGVSGVAAILGVEEVKGGRREGKVKKKQKNCRWQSPVDKVDSLRTVFKCLQIKMDSMLLC